MPVYVAALRRRRTRRQFPSALQDREEELWQPIAGAKPTEPPSPSTKDEGCWIRRNLKSFYTEVHSEREKATRPVNSSISDPAAAQHKMDQDRMSPLSPGLQQGNPILIPNGVEKSFKSRRSFSELVEYSAVYIVVVVFL